MSFYNSKAGKKRGEALPSSSSSSSSGSSSSGSGSESESESGSGSARVLVAPKAGSGGGSVAAVKGKDAVKNARLKAAVVRQASSSESDSDSASDESDESESDESESESDSDSNSNSDSDSDSESVAAADGDVEPGKKKNASRFLRGAASSGSEGDSDDDEDAPKDKRVVVSARAKRSAEIDSVAHAVSNAGRINDWVALLLAFERLVRLLARPTASSNGGRTPAAVARCLVAFSKLLDAALIDQDARKRMNSSNARALVAMKQKFRKFVKQYQTDMDAYSEKPYEDAPDHVAPSKHNASARSAPAPPSDDENEDNDGFESVKRKPRRAEPNEDKKEFNAEAIFKHLAAIRDVRGKKSTDKTATISEIKSLLAKTRSTKKSPYMQLLVLLHLIPSYFDSVVGSASYMATDLWKQCESEIHDMMTLLDENPGLEMREDIEELEDETDRENVATLRASIVSFVDRLDEEFLKSLQSIDPHTTEYIDRLKDETKLYGLFLRVQEWLEKRLDIEGTEDAKVYREAWETVVLRRLEHIYYKPDIVISTAESSVRGIFTIGTVQRDPGDLIHGLCIKLYKSTIDRVRTRAILCHVYHHALHNRFYAARDMFLMSHIADNISHSDIPTQVLYNRAMVQLGFCAFRMGMIDMGYKCLHDICISGKPKELLGQGFQPQKGYIEVTPEQEKNARQLPFHMHINVELLECVYLSGCMLLEVPHMAQYPHDSRKRPISKTFRRMLDYSEKQVFNGPPETTRDHIMGAAKALSLGEWQKCRDLMNEIKIWNLMPGKDDIKKMLEVKIKEEGLRTYIFTYAPHYDSISLDDLSQMFDIPRQTVYSILSKMILHESIHGTLDTSSGTLSVHKGTQMSRLEWLAVQYSDRVGVFVEGNERMLDGGSQHHQGHGGNDRRKDGGGGGNTGGGGGGGNKQDGEYRGNKNNNRRDNNQPGGGGGGGGGNREYRENNSAGNRDGRLDSRGGPKGNPNFKKPFKPRN